MSANQLTRAERKYPLEVFQCTACGHVQLLDVVDPVILLTHYLYVSATSPVFTKRLDEYAQSAVKRFSVPLESLVIELGSNDGTLLDAFQRRGMTVLGVEPARNLAVKATADGLETLPDFFTRELATDIRRDRGAARLVVANNVFAHADDLGDITIGVRELLSPEGVFIFEVSYLLDVFEKTLFDTIYHEHLSYHSVAPLRAFFANYGMQLFDVARVEPQGGSIRCMVQLEGGLYDQSASVEALVDLERQTGLDKPASMLGLAAKLNERKAQLTELIIGLKRDGNRIAAYGAPAKATTLLYYFGLSGDVVDFIVDDNPLKQGLFTPGLHIPVVPPQRLYDESPEYVVILAWNFADSIMAAHRDFTAAGGHFIVPLPEVKII